MIEFILMASILSNIVCLYFIGKRIEIVHERITLICQANGLWGEKWGSKK